MTIGADTDRGEPLAEGRFTLATILWEDPTQRVRARALAEQAREGYAGLGAVKRVELARAHAWLGEHRVP